MSASSRTRVLVEVALTIALAAVLHLFRLYQMPFGGSISLQMLPLFVLGLRRGPIAGLVAGALYGGVDFMIEPFPVHWAQVILDYPLAFAAVGALAGLWAPLWRAAASRSTAAAYKAVAWIGTLAVISGSIGRYVAHFISGVIFFATTAMGGPLPDGQSAFANTAALSAASIYSALYNLYVPASAAICLVAIIALLPALERGVPSEGRP